MNSPFAVYQLSPEVIALFRFYGTKNWDCALASYLAVKQGGGRGLHCAGGAGMGWPLPKRGVRVHGCTLAGEVSPAGVVLLVGCTPQQEA